MSEASASEAVVLADGAAPAPGAPRLLLVEPPCADAGTTPWILDARGHRTTGLDDRRRMSQIRAGLLRHPGVSAHATLASAPDVERVLRDLHEPGYLQALARARGRAPVLIAELAEPGLEPDTPVSAAAVAAAREGVATAIMAAREIAAGARFSYALCRPPGHHAGPAWLGGYCYLNNAAAAARVLRAGGFARVAILDLDLHYPNGTAAILAHMRAMSLYSLHGATGANLPWERVRPRSEREHLISFRAPPSPEVYLTALARCTRALARRADAIVLSLGYDTVAGDPHGNWSFPPSIFTPLGRLLAATELPICVVQEGGYALASLARCSHAFATGLLTPPGQALALEGLGEWGSVGGPGEWGLAGEYMEGPVREDMEGPVGEDMEGPVGEGMEGPVGEDPVERGSGRQSPRRRNVKR